MALKTEKELNMIRGKMMVGAATKEEQRDFLTYVALIEGLLEEVDGEDFYGTEGWRHHIGLD